MSDNITLSVKALAKRLLVESYLEERVAPEELAELERVRPRYRADCEAGERPCPFVGCRHHLFLDVSTGGSLTLNFPELAVEQLEESCSLDVADKGGIILEAVGELLNVTRERIRQIEEKALRKGAAQTKRLGGNE